MKREVIKFSKMLFPPAIILVLILLFVTTVDGNGQKMPRALIITGNGNVPQHKKEYPPWIHDFQNDMVTEILKETVQIDVTEDLSILQSDRLANYDVVISNSIFLTPSKEQLHALHQFVAEGKSYLTLHCGILSMLNWDEYERFIGGIFIGGPSSVPARFKVVTENIELWGYKYPFREYSEHPVSNVVDDFVIQDELYHFQPSIPDFHVLARAENLPVMWWHPVGKGKVMSLTLGHDEVAKSTPGYQQLLVNGVRWLTGIPLIQAVSPKPFSNRKLTYENFILLRAATNSNDVDPASFSIKENADPQLYNVTATRNGSLQLKLSGKTGKGKFSIEAKSTKGFSSTKKFDIHVMKDGSGNIASYFGNTAVSSSNENQSGIFDPENLIDGDSSTRWSSAPTDTAWIVIDLQKSYNVARITLEWEASFARRYSVLGSENGLNWKPIFETSDSDGQTDELRFNPTSTRFIKILATERANKKWGYSLYEVRVFKE
jgi:type 1 glutamine amidotransferase